MTLLGIINDFMNGTGIHGLAYVVPGKSPTFERLAWTFFILGAIGYASYQLNEAVVCKSTKRPIHLYLIFEKSSLKKSSLKKSSSRNWIFNLQKSISKLIFAGYTGSINPV